MDEKTDLTKDLTEELKRYSSFISHVTYTAEFVFVFFRKFPKRNVQEITSAIITHLNDKTGLNYTFFTEKENQWVFKV